MEEEQEPFENEEYESFKGDILYLFYIFLNMALGNSIKMPLAMKQHIFTIAECPLI